jgi:hypothetical protein
MIPLILVPDSSPDLFVKCYENTNVIHSLSYKSNVSLIWGPLTDHSTGIFSYSSGYHVCMSVTVACITPGNVKRLLLDISQQYPPRKSSLLLEWAKSPHFCNGQCNLPRLSHEALLGSEWLKQ